MPRRTCSSTSSLLVLLASCAAEPAPSDAGAERWWFHHDATGVSFELPKTWAATDSGPALVFSGPEDSDSYYTTITLQAAVRHEPTLDAALTAAHADLAELAQFAWLFREVALVDTRPALRYGLQVELHESLRIKHGVLFEASQTVVDLAYSGTPEVFSHGLPAFEHALATLSVVDTTP